MNQLPVLCWHRGLVHRLRVLGELKLSLPRGLLVALCFSRSWSDEVSWFKWFGLNATVPQPPREDPRRTARQLRSRGLHPTPSPKLPRAAPPLPHCIFDAQNLKCAKYINKVCVYIYINYIVYIVYVNYKNVQNLNKEYLIFIYVLILYINICKQYYV